MSDLRSYNYTKGGCPKNNSRPKVGTPSSKASAMSITEGRPKNGMKIHPKKSRQVIPWIAAEKKEYPKNLIHLHVTPKKNASKDHCLSQKGSGSGFFGHIFKDMVKTHRVCSFPPFQPFKTAPPKLWVTPRSPETARANSLGNMDNPK